MTQRTVYLTRTTTLVVFRPTTETNRNPTTVTTATIPYIKGTSETIARILQPYNVRVAHKPTTRLRHYDIYWPTFKTGTNLTTDAVYKIRCSDCQASFTGETGRNLNTRLTELKRATRNGDVNNHKLNTIDLLITKSTGTLLNV